MVWIWMLNVIAAICFVYWAARNDVFRESRGALWLGAGTGAVLGSLWLASCQTFKGNPYTVAFVTVLGTLIIGVIWGIFFALVVSEKMVRFLHNLTAHSGEVVKRYDRAVALEINARFEEAIRVYGEYAGEDPKDYVVKERIARCYFHLGKPEEAIQSLQSAFALLRQPRRMERKKKQEEMARLLFLQRAIREKFSLGPDENLEKALMTGFARTRFGQATIAPDPLCSHYLEIWSDCRQG